MLGSHFVLQSPKLLAEAYSVSNSISMNGCAKASDQMNTSLQLINSCYSCRS